MRIILSIIALAVAALGVTQAAGGVHWNAAVVDLVMAGGTLLGTFGVAPFDLTLQERRVCAGLATFTAAIVTAHASGSIPGAPKIFNVVAAGAAVLSVLGRWQDVTPVAVPAGGTLHANTVIAPEPTTPTKA